MAVSSATAKLPNLNHSQYFRIYGMYLRTYACLASQPPPGDTLYISQLTAPWCKTLLQTTYIRISDPQNQFLLADVIPIGIYSLRTCTLYYSKPKNAQKLVCVEQQFVVRVLS